MTDNLFAKLQTALQPALQLERELGGGGMSRVFVATDVALERPVVVKVLPPERAAALSAERFRREILIAAKLQHPNIVPVLAAGAADGVLWYSMPYVSGRSLRHRLADHGAIAPSEAIPIMRDIARALAVAHRQGIVHRDIKPENVLLTDDGAATVTDFGIAKALDSARTVDTHDSLTQAGNSIGTPHYMAPEQIAGDPHIDGRVDLYAFGTLAYEMLSGHTPFHGRANSQVMSAHLTEQPVSLSQVAPAVSDALTAIVHRCLAKDPAARPSTADEVVQLLDSAATTGSVQQMRPPAHRRRRRAIAAIIALGTVGVGFWQWQQRAPDVPVDINTVAVAPFRVVGSTRELDWLKEGMLDLLASKLTGEGGVKATPPRAMLAEWQKLRENAKDADFEPTLAAARDAARRLGAGRLLLGEILPSTQGVELIATVVDAVTGKEFARYQARGSRDSVVALADQLGAQLLSGLSGESSRRSSPLTRVSLDALRPYLEGQSLLRQLRAEDATKLFMRALEVDSTFALAGIGAAMSTSWYGDQEKRNYALTVAWSHQTQLSPRDNALLRALTGPRFPANSSSAELLSARAAYLALANDSPEAWYLYGDHVFHFGPALGIADALDVAATHFRRALELDSAYVPGYSHLSEIAIARREDSLAQRLDRLQSRFGRTVFNDITERWHRAAANRDTVTLRALEDSIGTTQTGYAFTFADYATTYGEGMQSAMRLLDRAIAGASNATRNRNASRLYAFMLMNAGAPQRAVGNLEASGRAPNDPVIWTIQLRLALVGDGDHAIAHHALEKLRTLDGAALSGTDSVALMQREATRAVGLWKLMHGDTTTAVRDIRRLHDATAFLTRKDTTTHPVGVDAHVEAFEALLTAARGDSARARVARERLHHALDSLNWADVNIERTVALSLVASQLFADAHDYPNAIVNASRNVVRFGGTGQPYFAVQYRRLAQLAERAGDPERAKAAWQRFAELRVQPEPAFVAELQAARAKLGAQRAK